MTFHNIIQKIAKKLPFLVRLKRFLFAYLDTIGRTKKSYSQFGEDLFVLGLFGNIPSSSIYIEVGANQPTQISNTYLFYRMGFNGIVIEPNREMTRLFVQFRPKDIHLEVGCSEVSGVGKFLKAESSVLSGFIENDIIRTKGISWVPLLTVDEIWRDAGERKLVFLLSVDTEGFDKIVLKGASETLKHTVCVIIETSEADKQGINEIMILSGFALVKTTICNMIWINEGLKSLLNQSVHD
jgi:FkbM family methyltransferase